MEAASRDCFVCRKHRGEVDLPGGFVYEDELVCASHGIIEEGRRTTGLGVLFVEPRRHAAGFADLTAPEAERVGLAASRLSRALEVSEAAERVYLFVLGHHVDHLHVWLVPRHPDTPARLVGLDVLGWEGAPRGDAEAIGALCDRIRGQLAGEMEGTA